MKLIGRADALRQVSQLLLQPDVRMVTLTGPAGVGKTRLAIEVAGEVQTHFEDGVVFVDLTRISDPALVLPTIAKALQARESIGSTLGDVVLYRLQAMSMLLIVDCFEHLQSAAPQVSKLLEDWRTRHVKLLVTSRERLRLSWESVYEVLPLAVPSDATTIDARQARRSPAVMLLTQLARANRPDFKVTDQNVTAVVDICRRLDGLPLALALSAPHLAHVEPQELAARLQPTLPLLDKSPRDAPERHRTMRTAIAWSYERLDPFEQALFRQLSVFVGGFTAELARDLAEFDTNSPDRATSTTDQAAEIGRALDALCDKSLVQRVPNGRDSRFRMLAPLRDFAQEQAERHGEAETVRRRLGSHFVELAAQTDPRLSGSRQVSWLNFIEAERANLDAVLQWSLKQGDSETGLRVTSGVWRFWYLRSHYAEGRRWLEEFLALPHAADQDPLLRAAALNGLGCLARSEADYPAARRRHEEALELRQQARDEGAVAGSLNNLAVVLSAQGEADHAADLLQMALEINRRRDHREWIAINLNNLGNVARDQRRLEESARLQHDSLAMFEALDDAWGRAMALRDLACAEYDLGRLEEAAQRFETSRSICEQVGDRRGVSFALMGMAYIRMDQQRFHDAQQLLAESLEITTSLSDRWTTAKCIEGFGLLAAARGQLDRCERLIREAGALRRRIGAPRTPNEQYMILDRAAECFPNRAELVRDDNTHDEMDLRKLIAYARTDDEDESAKALAPSPVRGPAAVTRVLVVDDERSYRETLRVFLEPFHDQVDVVGETGTSEQAIVAASELRPDVVFLDLKIPVRPGMHAPSVKNGIAAIRAIRRESRDTAILIVSTSDQEPMDLFEAIRAGAVGYLAKTDVVDGRDLIKSINAVTRGQAFLGSAIEKLVRRYFALETGTEPTHEELDALDDVVRGGPAATVPTIVRKIQSSDLDSSALSSPAAVARPIKIFISYSHVDEQLKNELLKHLSVLSRIGVVDAWHDRMIDAGTDWREAIDDRLDTADVALLLISADFISSQYCWGAEMKSALARRARGEIHVIPVIMRACDWENAQFASLQVLPRDAVAIASHPDRDAAFAEVAREMRKLVDKLRAPQPLQVSSPLAPQPPAASRPRTVDAGGGAEHRTIGEAIEAAAPGECIHVRPGRYRECLTISKRLEIVGDGETADVVIEAENAPVVTFEADEGTLRRLSLRMIGGDASCVEIRGDLELHECDISSSGSFGVAIRGPGHPTLRRNRIHDCRGVGVLIIQPSQAILEGNEVVNNQALGILITGADPTLRSNDVKWNNRGGILIEQYSAGTLEDNEISKNQSFGVVVSSGANPRLTGNRIRGNADAGVGVSDATGSLEDNDISDNDQGGVTIMVGAAPHLAGNDIHDNRGFGVSISQASMGELENNTIRGNSAVGVEIGAECKPIVSANQIHRNGGVGISIDEGAGGVLTNNDLTDNVAGAWLLPPCGAPLLERLHNAE